MTGDFEILMIFDADPISQAVKISPTQHLQQVDGQLPVPFIFTSTNGCAKGDRCGLQAATWWGKDIFPEVRGEHIFNIWNHHLVGTVIDFGRDEISQGL